MTLRDQPAAAMLARDFVQLHPEGAAVFLETLETSGIIEFLRDESSSDAAALLGSFRPEVAAEVVAQAGGEERTRWLSAVNPSRSAVVLSRLDEDIRNAILDGLRPHDAREIREIMSYPPDSAGALMDPRVSHFRAEESAVSALQRLRKLRHLRINNLHLVDAKGLYVGSVRVQDLAVAESDQRLAELAMSGPASVQATAPRAEVVELLEQRRLPTVPVVDYDGHLVGVIRHEVLLSAVEAEASADIQSMVGASRNERALSPVGFAVKKRLPWLQVNLLTAFLASFVVGLFEGTIAQFTALAVLLPVVAGQSGNTGAQALAVTMRGLSLREIRVRNHAARVALKEAMVAAVNGVAVALVTAAAVFVWSRSAGLAAVIGVAMVASMVIAGLAGAMIPMILTLLGQDPAQSSSIVLTTVTDVAGFLSFLGLATLFISAL